MQRHESHIALIENGFRPSGNRAGVWVDEAEIRVWDSTKVVRPARFWDWTPQRIFEELDREVAA
jgi:hypothetical protein